MHISVVTELHCNNVMVKSLGDATEAYHMTAYAHSSSPSSQTEYKHSPNPFASKGGR